MMGTPLLGMDRIATVPSGAGNCTDVVIPVTIFDAHLCSVADYVLHGTLIGLLAKAGP